LVSEHRVRIPGIVSRCATSFAAAPDVLPVIEIEGGELDLCELLEISSVRKILVEIHKWAYWSRGLAARRPVFLRRCCARARGQRVRLTWPCSARRVKR